MGAILGSDLILSIVEGASSSPVCYSTDVQINREYRTRLIASPNGRSDDFISDGKGYTLEIPLLVVYEAYYNYLYFADKAESGARINWSASAFDNRGVVHSGQVLVTTLNLTSQMRDLIKTDVSLLGCGPLITEFKPINTSVYLSDFAKIQLPGCPNPYPVSVFWYDGTLLGPASNADEVVQLFNDYSVTHGNYYTISYGDGGCIFGMQIAYFSPKPYPTTIFAQPGAAFALSDNQFINNMLSPDQLSDQGLTPIG